MKITSLEIQNIKSVGDKIQLYFEQGINIFIGPKNGVSEHFSVPKIMDLEAALQYIGDDELVEITPRSIRIRKIF